jgi:uncharacterized protein YndB with AHSA1/START domain
MTVLPGADDLELVFTRTLAATRQAVYAAFTDPDVLSQWWGPEGYTVSLAQTDPRPSGRYRLVLQAPDGTQYPVSGTYVQADEPERVVMTDEAFEQPQDWEELHGGYPDEDDTPLRLIIRVLLDEAEDGTALTVVSRFPRVEQFGDVLRTQATAVWEQALDRLERTVSEQAAAVR